MTLIYVLCGGAVGAVARYLAGRAVRAPLGTFTVNVFGSAVLGLLSGLAAAHPGLPDWVRALVGVGFCGALTTYSTFAVETTSLVRARALAYASINVGSTLVLGLGATWLGWWLGSSAFLH